MRIVKNPQMQIGEIDISEIQFDPKSRDDIPQILKGLQYIYLNIPIRKQIFELLEKNISPETDKKNGRPGMELWKIFVMGVLRLNLNWDYDRLHEQVNQHRTIREMLGHSVIFDDPPYHLQTIKDNVSLLTPELLNEINKVVVSAGHVLVKKKENDELRGRCDSFVVETNVHYPTDINLLWDAMRKVITLTTDVADSIGESVWRQSAYNLRSVKRLMRSAQNKKRSGRKNNAQKNKNEEVIKKAHEKYISVAQGYIVKAQKTIEEAKIGRSDDIMKAKLAEIDGFIKHAERQIDQIRRRVILGEKIPHNEKVFSIFQPHTEWVSKGKAGVPFELGLKVCIIEDQYQFILYHQVMEKTADDQVAISIVNETKKYFPDLKQASFDKGFHSPDNQKVLSEQLEFLVLPRKGKQTIAVKEIESTPRFKKARQQHSAVESAINALEVHGLDRCPDNGIDGFKRYISLAVLARNIQQIGVILKKREEDRALKRKRYDIRANSKAA
jgi:transposase, IS5 family